jgi:sec-independent protein translocase protein TatC
VRLKRKAPQTRNSFEEQEELRASLGEHLDELRTRIIRVILIVSGAWVIGWYLQPFVYDYFNTIVVEAIKSSHPDLRFTEAFTNVTQAFMVKFKLSFMLALIITFPLIFLQLWGFISPGLKPNEKKPLKKCAPFSVILFALGVGCCWLILPTAFQWFASYVGDFAEASVIQEPGTLVFFILKMLLAFGLGFQLPLVIYFLGRIGLLTPETLTSHWRHATVAVFVLSAILTPSNDAFSMLMMAIPLSLLFIVSVWAVHITQKKGTPKEEEDSS